MATTFDNPVPRNPPTTRVYRGTPISDAELSQIGAVTPAQRAVYRAIREGGLKYESQIANATGMDDMSTCMALGQLSASGLVRRGQAPMNGFGGLGAFEIVERKQPRKPGLF